MTEYLNSVQAAQNLGVTKQAVLKWFKQGKFPNAHKVEGAIRIPLSDVEGLKQKKGA